MNREVNGTPLQYSCLENPMDGGTWWAARLWGRTESDTTERLSFHFSLSCIGEENGNPLQCSCLKNPRNRGARGAAVYGVAQSWTRLKRLSSSSSSVLIGLPRWCSGKESTCQCRKHKRCRLNPWVGKICWRRKCNPLHYSCLENSMDRGTWLAI